MLQEYRNPDLAKKYQQAIAEITTQPWQIMEICGGQTHSIIKHGLDQLLPPSLTLIHGPGCPVCVTPIKLINQAIALAGQSNVIFASFGDMLRVPGSDKDLLSVKAQGADIRIIYSPLDCLKIARDNPHKEVVFFGVGFETTAPATAMTIYQAFEQQIPNFSLLVSHVLVPPAIEAILSAQNCQVQGFLAAGHVCTVMGLREYEDLAPKYGVPIVVTGFEPIDILQGIYLCVKQLEMGKAQCENQYNRSVRSEGNPTAQQIMNEVFEITDQNWRGIGLIPNSGLKIKNKYTQFDASIKFDFLLSRINNTESSECISGEIMQGLKKPHQCEAFGKLCTPEHPLGAPMVSSEGACAAYYRYRSDILSNNK